MKIEITTPQFRVTFTPGEFIGENFLVKLAQLLESVLREAMYHKRSLQLEENSEESAPETPSNTGRSVSNPFNLPTEETEEVSVRETEIPEPPESDPFEGDPVVEAAREAAHFADRCRVCGSKGHETEQHPGD